MKALRCLKKATRPRRKKKPDVYVYTNPLLPTRSLRARTAAYTIPIRVSRPHHGPPRRRARVEPERDEVGGAGDDAGAIRMTQRERGDYFGLGARRRLDDADEVYGIGRGIVSRTDGVFFAARARTDAAAYHRDGPFRNLRVDGAADHAVRARQRARQRRLERAPRVRSVAGLDRHRPALVALVAFVCGFVCVCLREDAVSGTEGRFRTGRAASAAPRKKNGSTERKRALDAEARAEGSSRGVRGRTV